jgi:hypothetical protein
VKRRGKRADGGPKFPHVVNDAPRLLTLPGFHARVRRPLMYAAPSRSAGLRAAPGSTSGSGMHAMYMTRFRIGRSLWCGAVTLTLCAQGPAQADIDLEMRSARSTVTVGQEFEVTLYAVSDDAEINQFFSASQTIFTWDPAVLELLSVSSTGAIPLLYNGLPAAGDYGLNEAFPPQDGDGFHLAFANLGVRAAATPAGSLLYRFGFRALAPSAQTEVGIATTGGEGGETIVFGADQPNQQVTGALRGALIEITASCTGDLDGNGIVDFADLLILLSAWGNCPDDTCPADLDESGAVDFSDLLILLNVWGRCPE